MALEATDGAQAQLAARMIGYRWILEEQSKSVYCPPREKLMAIDGLQISSSATQQMEFHGDITWMQMELKWWDSLI